MGETCWEKWYELVTIQNCYDLLNSKSEKDSMVIDY